MINKYFTAVFYFYLFKDSMNIFCYCMEIWKYEIWKIFVRMEFFLFKDSMKKVCINFVTYKKCLYKECHGTVQTYNQYFRSVSSLNQESNSNIN